MYAVIETGGKQYRVSPGQTVEVELLPAEPGATVTLDRVLLVSAEDGATVGQPLVPGGAVVATVIGEGRGKKVIVFKYKPKKRYRHRRGHRQELTVLTIDDIVANGKSLITGEAPKEREQGTPAEDELAAPVASTETETPETEDTDTEAEKKTSRRRRTAKVEDTESKAEEE